MFILSLSRLHNTFDFNIYHRLSLVSVYFRLQADSVHSEILGTIGLVLVPISLCCMMIVILTYTLIRYTCVCVCVDCNVVVIIDHCGV